MLRKISLIVVAIFFLCFTNLLSQSDLISKADVLYKEGRYYDALHYYEKAFELNDHDPYLCLQLARCHLLISPRSRSLKYCNKAISLSEKTTSEMLYTMARAYHVNNEFDKAIQYYQESDEEKNNFITIKKMVSECLIAKKLFANPVSVDILNVGTIVNTEFDEYLPFITADYEKMFFTSTRPDRLATNTKGVVHQEDIYYSKRNQEKWTIPAKIKSLNDQNGHDACVGISKDGQLMFVYKGTNGGDLYISELSGAEWSKAKPIAFNSIGFEGAASLSPDGKTLYFIHVPPGTVNRDIFISSKTKDGKWSKPEPLTSINTIYDEESPYIHPDGKTLYFSSKGHSTMGGYDIFKSTRNSNGSWSEPENLGYPINSTADDMYFVLSANGKVGFYSSDKEGGYGKQDIYMIKMNKTSDYSLELLTGEVRDESGRAIEADIVITDNMTNELIAKFKSNSEDGKFLVSLPCGKNYGIYIEKDGFVFHSENAQLECQVGFVEVFKEVKLMGIHSGAKIVLNNIFFDSGNHNLKVESTIELQKLIKLLKDNQSIRIEISGHTDSVGDEATNLTLSEMRAQNVMNYLVINGISKTRIITTGFGSTQSIGTNDSEEGRRLNRRTEFKIL